MYNVIYKTGETMQPHSMCAVALAGYVWNRPEPKKIKSCSMEVEYKSNGLYKKNIYRLSNISISSDDREMDVHIIRDGGGISCTMNIRRSSKSEGSQVTMTHGQIHVAGLREVYNLYKNNISGGMHYNSQRYKGFKGTISASREKVVLDCEVIQKNGSVAEVKYELNKK